MDIKIWKDSRGDVILEGDEVSIVLEVWEGRVITWTYRAPWSLDEEPRFNWAVEEGARGKPAPEEPWALAAWEAGRRGRLLALKGDPAPRAGHCPSPSHVDKDGNRVWSF